MSACACVLVCLCACVPVCLCACVLDNRVVVITGTQDQVIAGCTAILRLIFREDPDCDHALDFLIPEHACGQMFGKGSAHIKEMQAISGCTLSTVGKVDPGRQALFEGERLFTAGGTLEQIMAVCQLVVEKVVGDPRYGYDKTKLALHAQSSVAAAHLCSRAGAGACARCGACKYRPEKPNTACRFGQKCAKESCPYSHASPYAISNSKPGSVACRNGIACTRTDCSFAHPSPCLSCLGQETSDPHLPESDLGFFGAQMPHPPLSISVNVPEDCPGWRSGGEGEGGEGGRAVESPALASGERLTDLRQGLKGWEGGGEAESGCRALIPASDRVSLSLSGGGSAHDCFVPGGIFMRDLPPVVTDVDLRHSLQMHAPVAKLHR